MIVKAEPHDEEKDKDFKLTCKWNVYNMKKKKTVVRRSANFCPGFSNNIQNVLEADRSFFPGNIWNVKHNLEKKTAPKVVSVLVSSDIKSLARCHQISG